MHDTVKMDVIRNAINYFSILMAAFSVILDETEQELHALNKEGLHKFPGTTFGSGE